MKDFIFHIDANNAFLSWTAVHRLSLGSDIDLRDEVSVIGGDEDKRHGIVLAKSQRAKALGIKTAMPLAQVRQIYPDIIIVSPDFSVYSYYSNAMIDILKQYTHRLEKFSIDECFIQISTDEAPLELAHKIKNHIKKDLGFTVNIGVSTKKVLAKMASDFKKPDMVHSLFPEEIAEKMWHMPVSELFMCGKKSTEKLNKLCIFTIGDLAHADLDLLLYHLNFLGLTLYEYANGIDKSVISYDEHTELKSIGNSTTTHIDIKSKEEGKLVILALCETVAMRLRKQQVFTSHLSIELVNSDFKRFTHSYKLDLATNSTTFIYKSLLKLLDEIWQDGMIIRKFGVSASNLSPSFYIQSSTLYDFDFRKHAILDVCIDSIREKFGKHIIYRLCFLGSPISPMIGNSKEENKNR